MASTPKPGGWANFLAPRVRCWSVRDRNREKEHRGDAAFAEFLIVISISAVNKGTVMNRNFGMLSVFFLGIWVLSACGATPVELTAAPTPAQPAAREGLQFIEFYSPM
jgi:hypothetical protein